MRASACTPSEMFFLPNQGNALEGDPLATTSTALSLRDSSTVHDGTTRSHSVQDKGNATSSDQYSVKQLNASPQRVKTMLYAGGHTLEKGFQTGNICIPRICGDGHVSGLITRLRPEPYNSEAEVPSGGRPVQPPPECKVTSSSGPLRPTSLLYSQGSCPNGTQGTCCYVQPCRQQHGRKEERSMIDCPNRQIAQKTFTEMFCESGSRENGEILSNCPVISHVLQSARGTISVGVSTPDVEPTHSIEVGVRARRPEEMITRERREETITRGRPEEMSRDADLPTCSICHLRHCIQLNNDETLEYNKLMIDLQNDLGVSMDQAVKERFQCEVFELARWCIRQGDVISKSGEFLPDRVVPHDTTASIDLTVENPVLKARPDKSSPQQKLDIAEMVEAKLRQGIIEKSSAPWSSNCVVIRKDGKTRIAVDYRKLNEVTVHDSYLLPKISEIYETLSGTEWFTSLDATQAYHQIPMKSERDKDLTSFVTPQGGLFRYRFMPFGLRNAGAKWTRFIDGALSDLRWNIALVYADDILAYTKNKSVMIHIGHLDQIFSRLRSHGVMIKGSKVKLGVKELAFLGQIVNKDGYRPDPAKIKAVAELQPPTNVQQLRRVLGLFAYYRKYIPKFAEIAAPLYALTGKNIQNKRDSQRRIVMNTFQRNAFDTLKLRLTTEPIFLDFPRWDCPFEVHCDGSKKGVAAVLTQIVETKERVLMYASKSLTISELNYIPYEQEALAMVWAIDLFNHYLRGRNFLVRSDCQALEWLKDKRPRGARINKWLLRLQEYDYKVVHRPGIKSANCDGLTRQPLPAEGSYNVEPFEDLPTDKVISVLTRAQRLKESEQTSLPTDPIEPADEPMEEKHSVDTFHLPEVPLEILEDEELFRNPFLPRRSNKLPFFDCKQDEEGWDIHSWIEHQQSSKFIVKLLDGMAKVTKVINLYVIVDGVLHLKADPTVKSSKNRIVVPECLRAFVIGQHHNMELHGHQGRKRTTKMICSRYYWPNMCEDIARWIRACSACSRRKTTRPMNSGLTNLTLATDSWDCVGIDIVGPLPVTNQ